MTAAIPNLPALTRRNFLKLAFGTTVAAAALARPRLLGWGSGDLKLGLWSGANGQDLLEGYQERSGMGLTSKAFASNEEILAALKGGADYDVVVLTAYAVAEAAGAGLIQPLDRNRLPSFARVPEEFRDGHRPHDPEDTFSAPKAWGTTGILYRTDIITRAPESWADFWALAEKHPGQTYVTDSAPEVIDAALYKLGYPNTETEPAYLEQARVELLNLRSHLGGFDSDYASRLASGQGALALGWSTDADRLIAAGLPVGFSVPIEGAEFWEDDFCIPANSGDPAAAHEFINYMLTESPPALPGDDLPLARLFAHTPVESDVTRIRAAIWREFRTG